MTYQKPELSHRGPWRDAPESEWRIHEPAVGNSRSYRLGVSFAAGMPDADGLPNRFHLSGEKSVDWVMNRDVALLLHEALTEALAWDGRTQQDHELRHQADVIAEQRRHIDALTRRLEGEPPAGPVP